MGIYKISEALQMAEDMELDLVEISPNAEPPVCKIMDYKKFLYEQKKREKELKAKSAQIIVKEIRFGPQTDEHDYEFKKKNAEKFLKRSEEHTSELQSRPHLVCRLLLEKKKKQTKQQK